jgi:hypothetical protein
MRQVKEMPQRPNKMLPSLSYFDLPTAPIQATVGFVSIPQDIKLTFFNADLLQYVQSLTNTQIFSKVPNRGKGPGRHIPCPEKGI